MSIGFTVTKDTLTPDLKKRVARMKARRPILEAMAETVVSMTKQAFYNPSLRPSAWAPKKDGSAATLMYKQVLRRSPRVVSVTNDRAITGSDRKYAATHQLGGTITIKPHLRKVRLALTTGGNLKRQKGNKNLAVFAKRRAKNARTVEAQAAGHSYYMPPRPFFPFTANGEPTALLKKRWDAVVRRKLGI